jgi:UDP-3-O-[3-hydroxymyristoyl] N-acetylglucosamine deacetylase
MESTQSTQSTQRTLKRAVRFAGIGLHSGRVVNVEIVPAPADYGIRFQRTDLANAPAIKADWRNVTATELSTTIGRGQNKVTTVEHLMAALFGVGVDDALVKIDGPEVPILDGSAAPFVEALLAAGTVSVGGERRCLVVKDTFEVEDKGRVMRVEPSDRLTFACTVEYPSAAIGRQTIELAYGRGTFLELSGARTFCHVREVDAMRAQGLALGGSLANAIVVTDAGVMNPEGLRSPDEFVRHKVLDAIGDLALLGAPLVGKVTLARNGHGLHARFMRELMARNFELVEMRGSSGARGHFAEKLVRDVHPAALAKAL